MNSDVPIYFGDLDSSISSGVEFNGIRDVPKGVSA